jgi:hypothetical protein
MYRFINENISLVLDSIAANDPKHVVDYDWLIDNIQQVNTFEYQRRYKH